MKKFLSFLVVIVSIYVAYEAYNYFLYRDIKVTNYEQLMKKAEYGTINHKELRIGAFDLIESHLCQLKTDEFTADCLKKFEETKEECAAKIIDAADITNFNENDAYELLRQFNVCRQ